ncbi:hypothetical protein ACFLVF_03480, partial [Chloroflexota bacterium]
MNKPILTLFVVILLATGVYSVFSVINDEIDLKVGTIIAVASFVVVLWCLSLQKQSRLKGGTVFLLLFSVLFVSIVT